MVAFNFKAQWAQLVADGIKRQTVRASLRADLGDTLQLYAGMRTKACRKLRADVGCVEAVDFWRGAGSIFYMSDSCCGEVSDYWRSFIDRVEPALRWGVRRNTYQVTAGLFVLLDGFGEDLAQFMDFFPPGFSGWLCRWEVRVHPGSAWEWFRVFPDGLVNGTRWQADGARYTTRPADFPLPGSIGLMRGIPADWVEVA